MTLHGSAISATLRERHLRFDGPIPKHLLPDAAEKRACQDAATLRLLEYQAKRYATGLALLETDMSAASDPAKRERIAKRLAAQRRYVDDAQRRLDEERARQTAKTETST